MSSRLSKPRGWSSCPVGPPWYYYYYATSVLSCSIVTVPLLDGLRLAGVGAYDDPCHDIVLHCVMSPLALDPAHPPLLLQVLAFPLPMHLDRCGGRVFEAFVDCSSGSHGQFGWAGCHMNDLIDFVRGRCAEDHDIELS